MGTGKTQDMSLFCKTLDKVIVDVTNNTESNATIRYMLGDAGYDTKEISKACEDKNIVPVIPPNKRKMTSCITCRKEIIERETKRNI